MVTFIVYFIKESRYSYRRTLSNWILIIVGITLIITLTFLIKKISQFSPDSWTLYPPLSVLGPDKGAESTLGLETYLITSFFKIIQVLVLAMILYVSFRWVVQKNRPI
jgi:heme/copper-type cytochrome/quinol oxidase subunit 1